MTDDKKINGFYRGQVLEHLTQGFCRIYIPGIHPESFLKYPEKIPPAEQAASLFAGVNNGSGEFTYPNISSIVWCFFANGDQNFPVYFASSLGGENAFGQYQLIKSPDISASNKHLITSGKTQVEFFEDGKLYCIVQDPDRRPAKINYFDNDDIQKINDNHVSSYISADLVIDNKIKNNNCQLILDNDYNTNGMAQMKTHFFDISAENSENMYVLSTTNNYTMTNDGQIVIDSISSHQQVSKDFKCKSEFQNNFDMTLSKGIALKNSNNFTAQNKSAEKIEENFNDFQIKNNNIYKKLDHKQIYKQDDVNITEQNKSEINQANYGTILINSEYALHKEESSNKTDIYTSKKMDMISDGINNSIKSEIKFNEIKSGSNDTKFNSIINKDFNIDSNSKKSSSSNNFIYSFKDTNNKRLINVADNIDSSGTISKVMQYSNESKSNKIDSISQQSITKDRGFSQSINIQAKTEDFNIESSAVRSTCASIKGSESQDDININVDGIAFDILNLNSKITGNQKIDCNIQSIHDTETATCMEKITNNNPDEKCKADITIDAKNGVIKLNITNMITNDNSHIILNKDGIIRLNSSKSIILESELITINSKTQTDLNSKTINMESTYNHQYAKKSIQLSANIGGISMRTRNKKNYIF